MIKLKDLGACRGGREWAESRSNYEDAWHLCERGDWMLWIAQKRNIDLKVLTKVKAECAKLVIHLMRDDRSIKALQVADLFYRGLATRDELDAAAADADAAFAAADELDAAAAVAAYSAVDTYAYYAADVCYAALDADRYAAYFNEMKILFKMSNICREYIKFEDLNMGEANGDS